MTQLVSDNLPTDPADIEQDSSDFFEQDIETAVEAVLVLGQLDPTEIDLTTGLPRWTEKQMLLISKAKSLLGNWSE